MVKRKQLFFVDTNIFIYYFQEDEKFGPRAKKILELLVAGKAQAVTSIITQVELLSLPTTEQQTEYLRGLFLETPNLQIKELTPEIADEAARIRREYKFRFPDAIQLATAVVSDVPVFITNDKRLSRFKELKIKLL